MKKAEVEMNKAREELRALLPAGSTVYTVLRHVSRSGMYRAIDVYVIKDGAPVRITYSVCKATGMTYSRRYEAAAVGGCGMDMGFYVVYNLSWALYGETGFQCTGKDCPCNEHNNPPFPKRDGEMWHEHGDYALRQRWM